MHTNAEKIQENKVRPAAEIISKKQSSKESSSLADNRPASILQRKFREATRSSPQAQRSENYQPLADNFLSQTVQRKASPEQITIPENSAPVQMMHPAFNEVNFWRGNVVDPETGESQPHPLSPEGKAKDLTAEFGAEVMKLLLHTNLDSEQAVERENLTRIFYRAGGTPWDAYYLLHKYPDDNSKLSTAFTFFATHLTGKVAYDAHEAAAENVQQYLDGFQERPENELHALLNDSLAQEKMGPEFAVALRPQLIALDILLKQKLQQEKGPHVFLNGLRTATGTEVSFFGPQEINTGKTALSIQKILTGLMGSAFITARRPPLRIRINVNPGVSNAIADTIGNGSFIIINLNTYQLAKFTGGQILGLLAHELGVHSLAPTTLSAEELATEDQEKDSRQQGHHQGEQFTIMKDAAAPKQQDDHLTIGRGLLGQVSAAPRLHMYEHTIVSIINALPDKSDQKEAAATYCIDIARILVLNDDPSRVAGLGNFAKMRLGNNIANTSVKEWERMKAKYGQGNPLINAIDISYSYIIKCLFKLIALINKVEAEGEDQ